MNKTKKVDVQTASRIFGISPDAVRKRIERKSLNGIKENGVWMVIVEDTKPGKRPEGDQTSPDGYGVALGVYKDAIDDMRGHITRLEKQLDTKDSQIQDLSLELRRKDILYMQHLKEKNDAIRYLTEPKKSFVRRLLSGRTDE